MAHLTRVPHDSVSQQGVEPALTANQRLLTLYPPTPFKPAGLFDLRYELSTDQGQCKTPAMKTLISPDFSTEHNHDGRI